MYSHVHFSLLHAHKSSVRGKYKCINARCKGKLHSGNCIYYVLQICRLKKLTTRTVLYSVVKK
jgi:hypothetical protein